MSNSSSSTTTNSYGAAIGLRDDAQYRDEVLVFTGAATMLRGTILGRIEASAKLKPWVADAVDGSQVAVALLAYDVTALGAGDVAARALVKGQVNRNRLIIAVDGSGVNITPALLDQLRDVGITPVDVQSMGQVG